MIVTRGSFSGLGAVVLGILNREGHHTEALGLSMRDQINVAWFV
jgi:hypothetical protein